MEISNEYKNLVGKHEEKIPFGRSRRKWQDNIKMDHQETGWKDVDWTHLGQNMDR